MRGLDVKPKLAALILACPHTPFHQSHVIASIPPHRSFSQTFLTSLILPLFFCPLSSLPYISSPFLFSKAPSHSVLGPNLNKQLSLCGESFPSRFLKECCLPSSTSPWLPGICRESHVAPRWIWTLSSGRLQGPIRVEYLILHSLI